MNSRFFRQLPARLLFAMGLATAFSLARADEGHDALRRPIAATWCADRCDAVITDWSLAAFQAIKAADGYQNPMAASRSLAMMHIAMHDAANAARPRYRRYALASAAQFRTAPPPALVSDVYRRDFDEVKRVGGKAAGNARSADETHYAAFWYEFSDIGWNRIARVVSGHVKQDLWERARTFALLNMAMADAYIAGWDSKYHHNAWRPVTAIQLAGQDGNPHTAPDASFETLLTTPPVPDLPSTHSALGMAAATVLAAAFGRDNVPFSFASPSAMPTNPVRSFRSFSEAARENADSRVKAGLHFRFATEAGLELGRQIGQHVARNALGRQHATTAQDHL